MREERPIFIVGMPRAGTTLLGMMLNSNSTLAIAPETKYFTRHWTRCRGKECLQERAGYREFVERLLAADEIKHFGFTDTETEEIRRELWDLKGPTHGKVLGTVLSYYARRTGKGRFGEKTPGHLPYVPLIAELFPQADFVYIVRDPRAVSFSLEGMPWMGGNAFNHSLRWVWYESLVDRFSQEGYPIHSIKYEDLVDQPEQVIRGICEFTGIPYESDMVYSYHRGDPIFDRKEEPWKLGSLQPIDPSRKSKWKRGMGEAEKTVVQMVAGRSMVDQGYDHVAVRMTPRIRIKILSLFGGGILFEARNLLMDPVAKARRLLTRGERSGT